MWALGIWTASFAGKKLPKTLSILVFPGLLAGLDLLTSLLSPHGSGGSIAYSQMETALILRLASLGGTPLITFMVLLISSLLSHFLLYGKKAVPGMGISLLLMAGLTLLANTQGHPAASKTLKLGLLASDQHQGVPEDWRSVWQDYRAALLEQGGADELIVMPEKLFQISEADAGELLHDIKGISSQQGAVVVLGLDERQGDKAYNRAYLVAPDGAVHQYDKQHMIPDAEDHFEKGEGPLQIPWKGLTLGLAICKDMDFPETIRAYRGSDLMLVPAWDFYEDDWFHSRMAIMRGVENGMLLVRSARRGFLTLADASGRVLAEKESRSSPMTYLSQTLEAGHQPTLYSSIGDVFGWLAMSYALLALLAALGADRRRGR